jgi:magnesium chelatase subunit D
LPHHAAFEVDGLRADIVTYKTAATLALRAPAVTPDDVRRAAEQPVRRRRQPFDQPD